MVAGGAFAGTAPRGSLGTFIGRRGSANLEADPDLGGLHKGADGMWRVEVRDDLATFNERGPKRSTLGRDLDHPTLYEAYPDLGDIRLRRSSDIEGAEFSPHKSPQEIGLGWANDKASVLHETQHAIQGREGFALGSNPDEELAMLRRDARRAPRLRQRTQQELERAKVDMARRRQNEPDFAGSEAEQRLLAYIESIEGETWGQAAVDRYGRSAGRRERGLQRRKPHEHDA